MVRAVRDNNNKITKITKIDYVILSLICMMLAMIMIDIVLVISGTCFSRVIGLAESCAC
jgi:hypothetical protein